jgi:DNA-binding LacI/PurR family transcriptional regulator
LAAETPTARKSGPVTIRDVAEMAGVSTATVSNVVNRTGSASQTTKDRVRAAIDLTRWTPDLYARGLACRRRSRGDSTDAEQP